MKLCWSIFFSFNCNQTHFSEQAKFDINNTSHEVANFESGYFYWKIPLAYKKIIFKYSGVYFAAHCLRYYQQLIHLHFRIENFLAMFRESDHNSEVFRADDTNLANFTTHSTNPLNYPSDNIYYLLTLPTISCEFLWFNSISMNLYSVEEWHEKFHWIHALIFGKFEAPKFKINFLNLNSLRYWTFIPKFELKNLDISLNLFWFIYRESNNLNSNTQK